MRSAKDLVIVASLMNITVLALLLTTSVQKVRPVVDMRSSELFSTTGAMVNGQRHSSIAPTSVASISATPTGYIVDEIDALIEKYEEGGAKAVATDYETYIIKQGDNPWKIAKRYGISFEELIEMNSLDSKKAKNLKIGQQIRVPARNASKMSTKSTK